MTILRRGLFLIAIPLLFEVAFIAVLAKMRSDGAIAVDWTIHTKDVIAQAQACRARVFSAHNQIQGLILTKDPSFADDLIRSIAQAPLEVKELRRLVSDREDQARAASVILQAVVKFLEFMDEGRDLVKQGRMDATTAASRRRQAQGLLEVVDADFLRFIDFERDLDTQRQARLDRSRSELNSLLLGGLVSSVLFTVIVAILFSRNISGRIANLTENSYRLAEGRELKPPISGSDEIAKLDEVFHQMAGTLAQATEREKQHALALERRAEELDKLNAQLREKIQENEMFVYSVSHDLRSPLVNLQGFGKELGMIGKDLGRLLDGQEVPPDLRKKAKGLIESDMAESIGFIQSAVTRLSGIIDGLLRLSRAGQVEYRRQAIEINPIVARIVAALRGTIEERQATLEVEDLPPVVGDPNAVEQIFANLIGNALNYLDRKRPGKIEVFEVDSAGLDGPVEALSPGLNVYAVRDNGLGIPDSYKSKVFSVFQRLHGEVAKGEGIGLALVRRMVERHGGRVWFTSHPGEGSTFFVALPSVATLVDESAGVEIPEAGKQADAPSRASRQLNNVRDAACPPSR